MGVIILGLKMKNPTYYLFFLFSFSLIFFPYFSMAQNNSMINTTASFHVGVILNLNSTFGEVAESCICMAISDYYAVHGNYCSKLVVHVRDSKGDVVTAASAALDLIENVEVQAIIGPETSEEADFLPYLGNKAHIPVISFSAISSSLSPTQFPYFVGIAQTDSSQVKAIAAIVQAYQWKEVSLIHEDSQSGTAAIPYLTDALQEIGTIICNRTILPYDVNGTLIKDTLHKLNDTRMRVFIVNLSFSLGTRFFLNVKEAGMMQDGYAWIVMSRLTNIMGYMNSHVFHSMEGVIGVRTYVPPSKALREFRSRWSRQFLKDYSKKHILKLNVYALWAYDATFLMAMAVHRGSLCRNSRSPHVSPLSANFLQSVLATQFTGLSGEIQLVNGQLQSSTFEIVNVRENRPRRIGYWTPTAGLSQSLSSKSIKKNYSANEKDLSVVTWPGGSMVIPSCKILKIGVPVKTGFYEFVNVSRDSKDGRPNVAGFSKDVFEAVMLPLRYRYEYVPFEDDTGVAAGNYNELTYQVYVGMFDAVMGDISIIPNRSNYVEFTQPYTVSGVRMIVPITEEHFTEGLWWFTKPLSKGLWLTTIAFFLFKGILVWIFEHGINPEFQGTLSQQLGKVLSFSFSTLVFAHREKLESNYSRFIVNMWTFAVFILVTSYTANLTSMLAIENLQPSVTDLDSLRKNGKSVGYQNGSFVFGLLKDMGFKQKKLKQFSTVEQYDEALSKGSDNDGVSAIVNEIPYINVFLTKYCHNYTITGPTYRTGGFGFAFPKNSPMLSDISKAILDFTEGKGMDDIENNWFGSESCPDPLATNITSNKLHLYSFRSIYVIMAVASAISLSLFFVSFIYKSAKDGTVMELLEGKALKVKNFAMGKCFRLPSHKFRDTGQPIRLTELQQNHEASPAATSVEGTLNHADEERDGAVRQDTLDIIESTSNDNCRSEIIPMEVTHTSPRK